MTKMTWYKKRKPELAVTPDATTDIFIESLKLETDERLIAIEQGLMKAIISCQAKHQFTRGREWLAKAELVSKEMIRRSTEREGQNG
jgi:hypothetical protein